MLGGQTKILKISKAMEKSKAGAGVGKKKSKAGGGKKACRLSKLI